MLPRRGRLLASTALLAALALGCSRGPKLAEVEGTVRMNGKPLGNVRVEFMPDPEKGTKGPTASGVTDSSGRYELKLDDQRPGAVVGQNRVLLHDLAPYENLPPGRLPDSYKLKPSRLPSQFFDASRTPILKEVKDGGRQTIDIDVQP